MECEKMSQKYYNNFQPEDNAKHFSTKQFIYCFDVMFTSNFEFINVLFSAASEVANFQIGKNRTAEHMSYVGVLIYCGQLFFLLRLLDCIATCICEKNVNFNRRRHPKLLCGYFNRTNRLHSTQLVMPNK